LISSRCGKLSRLNQEEEMTRPLSLGVVMVATLVGMLSTAGIGVTMGSDEPMETPRETAPASSAEDDARVASDRLIGLPGLRLAHGADAITSREPLPPTWILQLRDDTSLTKSADPAVLGKPPEAAGLRGLGDEGAVERTDGPAQSRPLSLGSTLLNGIPPDRKCPEPASQAKASGLSLVPVCWAALAEPGPEERTATGRDWIGLTRDTALFVGYQVAVVAIAYPLPASFTNWHDKEEFSFKRWWDHVSHPPVWDNDDPFTNYIVHPYFGATYYIRARERGFGKIESFLYSALLSTIYEYGVEAFFEPPSNQDLISTPIGGALIGMFLFEPIRDWIKAKPELRWYDHVLLVSTDPLGAINSVVERLLGIKSTIRVQLSPPRLLPRDAVATALGGRKEGASRPMGVSMSFSAAWP
jgi:hypothetical protein